MAELQLGFFASGRGSNVAAILKAIEEGRLNAGPRLIISNNPEAGVLDLAREKGVPAQVVCRPDFPDRNDFVQALSVTLKNHGVDFIVLAGYMKKVPQEIIREYTGRMTNIHPGLLPAFGGRGMYGHHVHQAVLEHGCKVSGVTVHLVDEIYDHGPILAQRCVPVEPDDTSEALAARVLQVEHALYWEVLQAFAEERVMLRDFLAQIR